MKKYFHNKLIALFIIICYTFSVSCDDNETIDSSLLVGLWDAEASYDFSTEEWGALSYDFGYWFDGKYHNMGGPLINGDFRPRRYFYDETSQIINIPEADWLMRVLSLTETELIIREDVFSYNGEKEKIGEKQTRFSRRIEN